MPLLLGFCAGLLPIWIIIIQLDRDWHEKREEGRDEKITRKEEAGKEMFNGRLGIEGVWGKNFEVFILLENNIKKLFLALTLS